MLDSLHSVDREFLKTFLGDNLDTPEIIVYSHKAESIHVPVIYARKSAVNRKETETRTIYPTLAIEMFTPYLIKDWNVFYKSRVSDLRDTDDDGVNDTVTEFEEAVPLEFRYELNLACKSESSWNAVKEYFFTKFAFQRKNFLTFNKISVSLNDSLKDTPVTIGDYVSYKFSSQDIPRSDGILETQFVFLVQCFVHLHEPIDYDVLEETLIRL